MRWLTSYHAPEPRLQGSKELCSEAPGEFNGMVERNCYELSIKGMLLHVITKARRFRDTDSFKMI